MVPSERGDGGLRSLVAFARSAPWLVYAPVALLTLAYLYWRLVVFPTSRPPEIYFTAPHGLTYVPWALGKLLHMVFALAFHTPMFLGLATYGSSVSAHVLVFGVMAVLVGLLGAWYVWASRGLASRAVWPVWLVAAFVPVIPVFVMPHFGYLPAAALAVMLAVMVRALRGRWRILAAGVVLASSLWSLTIYRFAWRGIVRNEQVVYADIEDNTPRPAPGARLFFINLPVAGIYASVALREAWGLDDLEGYVLTFAPQPLMMDRPSVVERVGRRELIVSTPPPGYFSGLSGRMLIDGMRPGKPLTAGEVIPGELFDTTILQADARGVTRLKFTFKQPLDSPNYYFFVSTPIRPACRLTFGSSGEGQAAVGSPGKEKEGVARASRPWPASSDPPVVPPERGDGADAGQPRAAGLQRRGNEATRQQGNEAGVSPEEEKNGVARASRPWPARGGAGERSAAEMLRIARVVAEMRADPAQAWLMWLDANRLSERDTNRLRDWCRRVRAVALYEQWTRWRDARRTMLTEREYYFRIIRFFGQFVHSDLFLTASDAAE